MLEGNWVALLFGIVILGGCSSNRLASNQVCRRPLGNAQLGVDFFHLRNDKKLQWYRLLVHLLFFALVHRLCADQQDGMVEEVAGNVASCLRRRLLQGALEHQLSVLVCQFQIDKLSRPELEILVELHEVEVVLRLSGFNVDL